MELQGPLRREKINFVLTLPDFENLRESSRAILVDESFAMRKRLDYGDWLKMFMRRFLGIHIRRTRETELLYRIGESMFPQRETIPCRSMRELADAVSGCLTVWATAWHPEDHFERLHHDDQGYSIVRGCSISPYAQSVLQGNARILDGLLLDATWTIP
jgi:hypothetical protein